MSREPLLLAYESMGTQWRITVWDAMGADAFAEIREEILRRSEAFDAAYSRFRKDSLVWKMAGRTGVVVVPRDLIAMLRLYATLYGHSGGKVNPLVGFALSDLGYDAEYSFSPKNIVRRVPDFFAALRMVDDERIEFLEPALIDLGAIGKGYFVDRIGEYLAGKGLRRWLVDGSGDILYRGDGHPIRAGLEHPGNPARVIGVIEIVDGAFCASAGNRRAWGGIHHIIDPSTLRPPAHLLAAWVSAESAAVADGLTTGVFLAEPERFREAFAFEYCLLNDAYHVKRSTGFNAELF